MLKSLEQKLFLLLPVALFVAASPAHAGLVTYSDVNAWTTATNTVTSVGFESLAPVNSFKDYSNSTGLIISGLQFQGFENLAAYDLQVIDAGQGAPYYNFGSGASLKGPSYNAPPAGFTPYIHVILPMNTTAFGVDLMTASPNSLNFQVTIAGQTFTVNTASRPTRTFFGVTSDAASIASADFAVLGTSNGGGTNGLMDNFRYGAADAQAAQTPELGTLLLIGSGLIAFRMLRKSRPSGFTPLAA